MPLLPPRRPTAFISATPLLLMAVLLATCTPRSAPAPLSETRPNLIFLLTDDQRWDAVGYAGNPIVETPTLDSLARGGVAFRNAYVTTSICAVSRATLLSGQYARRHGIHDFSTVFSDSAFARTYPMRLKAAGYRIGFIGKYGVGNDLPADAFDYWRGFPGQGRYELTDSAGAYLHLTRLMGRQAVEFLDGVAPGEPFALSISFKAPHVQDGDPRQFLYDPAYEALYQDVVIPLPETATPAHYAALPDFFRASNEARERWKLRFETPEQYQRSVKGYYCLITGVDHAVAEVLAALRRHGLAENTVIVFTSDNGFYLGEHGLAGKWYGHEESIRVPLLIYDPRLPAARRGTVRAEVVLNLDVAPTLLDLAGVPAPAAMQGRSLVPLVRGQTPPWRTDFFYEHLFERQADQPAIHRSEGVVTPRYKYLRYIDRQPPYEVLYDLDADPHETRNLADDAAYQATLEQMRDRWRTLRDAAR